MVRNLRFIVLCLLTITVYSAGPAASEASAADERNWIDSPLYHRQIPKPADGDGCIEEEWIILGDPRVDFHGSNTVPRAVCAYHADGFSYGIYQRAYTSHGLDNWTLESKLAVKKAKDNYARPIDAMNFPGPVLLAGSGYSKNLIMMGSSPGYYTETSAIVFDDFLQKLTIDLESGYYIISMSDSRPLLAGPDGAQQFINGYGISRNGQWIAVISRGQLIRINMLTNKKEVIANRNFVEPYMWPDPVHNAFISDDGTIMGYAGRTSTGVIFRVTNECIDPVNKPSSYLDSRLYTNCEHRVIGYDLDTYSQPISYYSGGVRWYLSVSINSSGELLQYKDSHDVWHQLSYENFTGNKYLALGDSYASGEGDIDAFGVSHYLKGTNIWGDYAAGIPRENCHVSERSYPFLIAAHAGLQRQFGMETVACSGAVQLNIAKRLDDTRPHIEYVNGVYMGQLTQRDGQDRPRLEGIENATALQQEALDMLLPGRVQQIEQLKRQQPYVATVQISGNDLNFGPIVASCSFNLPTVHSQPSDVSTTEDCDWSKADFRAKIAAAILGNRSNLVKLYAQLKQASPNTQFYAVGYPLFVNQAVFCLDMPSLSPAELEFMRESIRFANVTIRSAASEAGFRYIDIENALGDQAICGEGGAMTSPLDFVAGAVMADMKRGAKIEEVLTKYSITEPSIKRYIRALYTDWERLKSIDIHTSPYLRYLDITQQLFHPNAEGHRLIAEKITGALSGATILSAACDGVVILCPDASISTPPEVPAFFGKNLTRTGAIVESASIVVKTIQSGVTAITKTQNAGGIWVMRQGAKFKVVLMPGVAIVGIPKVVLHSDTYELGELALESPGVYAAELAIPDSVPVGMHTLEITATTASKAPYYALMPVAVIGSQEDEDGDGIIDSIDGCLYSTACLQLKGENLINHNPVTSPIKKIHNTVFSGITYRLEPSGIGCLESICSSKSPIDGITFDGKAVRSSESLGEDRQHIATMIFLMPAYVVLAVAFFLSIFLLHKFLNKKKSSTDI